MRWLEEPMEKDEIIVTSPVFRIKVGQMVSMICLFWIPCYVRYAFYNYNMNEILPAIACVAYVLLFISIFSNMLLNAYTSGSLAVCNCLINHENEAIIGKLKTKIIVDSIDDTYRYHMGKAEMVGKCTCFALAMATQYIISMSTGAMYLFCILPVCGFIYSCYWLSNNAFAKGKAIMFDMIMDATREVGLNGRLQ